MAANVRSLLAYQASRKQRTIDALEEIKRIVEAELEQHGYYPKNSGRLNKAEMLRRACVSAQTLKNSTHTETAASLAKWLSRVKRTAPTLKPDADDAKAKKIQALQEKLTELARHYDRFKLEYNELLHRCEELEIANSELRQQAVGSRNLVSFQAKRPGLTRSD